MRSPTASMCSMALIVSLGLASGVWPSISRAQAPAGTGAAGAAGTEQPSQIIQSVAQRFLQDLDAHRAAYQKDPKLLRAAVDRDVLPYFDVQFAARLVLARYWRTATPQQRQRFISAFENSMFANYGSALLGFQSNRLKVDPTRVAPGEKDAMVRTMIRRDDGSTVQVNFMLRDAGQGWKVWDVIVEGVSYIKSFRDDFGSQIEQQGLDAVIQRLERGEAPPQIVKPGAKGS
jgi:phospholipid transport system substrate-binding protein